MPVTSVAFITIWFGDWPWYFPYFLHTCKYNYSVDFFIFTDNNMTNFDIPSNIHIFSYSLEQFRIEAQKNLGFTISIESSYKLCDFKPAYGLIFYDSIKKYDFWGYCDTDIIWGDIRSFMTDQLLNEYDVISARHDYLTGCFALYRNNKKMRELFMESGDYKKVFTEPQNFFFDETNFAFDAFEKGLHYSEIHTEIESMTHVVRRLEEEGCIKAYFEFQLIEGFGGNMIWKKGKLIYRKEYEALCYHLVRFKKKYTQAFPEQSLPERFRIDKTKITY